MANAEHLALLQQGIVVWNDWRRRNPGTLPDFSGANLNETDLTGADLSGAILSGADLIFAKLDDAYLSEANLSGAILSKANLDGANLRGANLSGADLSGANLNRTELIGTDFTSANLTGSSIYGIAAWDLKLTSDTRQENLIITPPGQPVVAVDNIKVAQFVYLLLNNEEIRDVIDTITSKAVLILNASELTQKALFLLEGHASRNLTRDR